MALNQYSVTLGYTLPKVVNKSQWWIKDGELKLFNPDINIEVNNATVLVRVKRVNVKTPNITFTPSQLITLTKEKNKWLIKKIE